MSNFNQNSAHIHSTSARIVVDEKRRCLKFRLRRMACARLLMFLFIGFHCSSAFAANYTFKYCSLDVKFTSVKKISINYLGWLATPVTFSGNEGTIVYWPFDNENQPLYRGWTAVGLAVFSTGDIASDSVGGILWTKGNGLLNPAESPKSSRQNEAGVTFDISKDGKLCDKHLIMRISNDGSIYIAHHLLSNVRQ